MDAPSRWSACSDCRLCESRTRIVWGTGDSKARVLLLGEAPGRFEDEGGEPFVGRSGKLLDRVLAELGRSRREFYITNVVRCRPPKNRAPRPDEMAACREKLVWEAERVSPDTIITLGRTAARALLGRNVKLEDDGGKMESVRLGGISCRVVIGYHPAACIYHVITEARLRQIVETALK